MGGELMDLSKAFVIHDLLLAELANYVIDDDFILYIYSSLES